jgi:hypothetical protein
MSTDKGGRKVGAGQALRRFSRQGRAACVRMRCTRTAQSQEEAGRAEPEGEARCELQRQVMALGGGGGWASGRGCSAAGQRGRAAGSGRSCGTVAAEPGALELRGRCETSPGPRGGSPARSLLTGPTLLLQAALSSFVSWCASWHNGVRDGPETGRPAALCQKRCDLDVGCVNERRLPARALLLDAVGPRRRGHGRRRQKSTKLH